MTLSETTECVLGNLQELTEFQASGAKRILEERGMARPERFELPTYWFEASCSIRLSYGRSSRHDSMRHVSDGQMIGDGQRLCDRCGQPIPPSAKLAGSGEEGQGDLCLQCRIRASQEKRE